MAETWKPSICPAKNHTLLCGIPSHCGGVVVGGAGEHYAGGVVILQGEPWLTALTATLPNVH